MYQYHEIETNIMKLGILHYTMKEDLYRTSCGRLLRHADLLVLVMHFLLEMLFVRGILRKASTH